jgi:hypothetical protein
VTAPHNRQGHPNRPDNRTESTGHRHAVWPAASGINCEITSGCDIRDRWGQTGRIFGDPKRPARPLRDPPWIYQIGISRYDIPRVFDPKFTAERAF